MAFKIFCDRCGREIDGMQLLHMNVSISCVNSMEEKRCDLCSDCSAKLEKWIESGGGIL